MSDVDNIDSLLYPLGTTPLGVVNSPALSVVSAVPFSRSLAPGAHKVCQEMELSSLTLTPFLCGFCWSPILSLPPRCLVNAPSLMPVVCVGAQFSIVCVILPQLSC